MKRVLLVSLLSFACAAAEANGDISAPSRMSAEASGLLVNGSLTAVAASGAVVVTAVEVSGEGVVLVLQGAGEVSSATVRLSGKAARGLSIATGTVLEVVAISSGHVLVLSGKALAFVPNEMGKLLLHHERVAG
jgi:hypothetical protein